jgi:DNA repair exonuclease SbcCD ATPase subunit
LAHRLVLRLCQFLQVGIEDLYLCQTELDNANSALSQKKSDIQHKLANGAQKIRKVESILKIKSVPYDRCPVCEKKFKGLDYIDRHILNRHSELSGAWDVIRGRKSPEKTASVQQILDKIDGLRNSLRRGEVGQERRKPMIAICSKTVRSGETFCPHA